jgi:hypothetical protein
MRVLGATAAQAAGVTSTRIPSSALFGSFFGSEWITLRIFEKWF